MNERQPVKCTEVPRDEWVHRWPFNSTPPSKVFRSRNFLVQWHPGDDGDRLSINRTEFDPSIGRWSENITWDELQRIKSECGFGDRWAVEVFPPDAAVVNVANMRHLWLLPEAPPYGWKKGAP